MAAKQYTVMVAPETKENLIAYCKRYDKKIGKTVDRAVEKYLKTIADAN